jgi:hypothetical protein
MDDRSTRRVVLSKGVKLAFAAPLVAAFTGRVFSRHL